jgi:hypothetical protein
MALYFEHLNLPNFELDVDPNPDFHLNADPYPASQNNPDSDLDSRQKADPDPPTCLEVYWYLLT